MSAPQPIQPQFQQPQPPQQGHPQQPYGGYPQQQPQYQQPYQQAYPQQQPYNYAAPRLPFEPGNFFLRFIAWILDDIIVGMITGMVIGVLWVIGLAVGYLAGSGGGALLAGVMLWFISIPVGVLTFFVYHIKFETGPMQATPAKRMVGLRIVNQNGGTINAGQSIGRILSMVFLSSMFFFVGYFLALFTEKKQALHDLIAGTIVIKG